MLKRALLSVFVICIEIYFLDILFNGIIYASAYKATEGMWRSGEDLKFSIMYLTMLVSSICFVAIYGLLVKEKSLASGVKLGLLLGFGVGTTIGSFYAFLPIPLGLAFGWFLGTFLQMLVAGVIVGFVMTPKANSNAS